MNSIRASSVLLHETKNGHPVLLGIRQGRPADAQPLGQRLCLLRGLGIIGKNTTVVVSRQLAAKQTWTFASTVAGLTELRPTTNPNVREPKESGVVWAFPDDAELFEEAVDGVASELQRIATSTEHGNGLVVSDNLWLRLGVLAFS